MMIMKFTPILATLVVISTCISSSLARPAVDNPGLAIAKVSSQDILYYCSIFYAVLFS
jgi:hypothetical protein